MKPVDPAVLPHLAPARGPLAVALVGSLVSGLAVIGQAFALGALIVGLVTGRDGWREAALWLGVVVAVRAVAGYVVDVSTTRAAGLVSTQLRRRLLAGTVRTTDAGGSRQGLGEVTVLATRGISAVEPWLTRYLPSLVLAAVLPAATILVVGWLDWSSGLILLLTVPLIPVFAILIGLATRDASDRQWRALAQLSGHFLDVVRGLPTLVAHRRAKVQSDRIRAITDRYRARTLETLRIAFASSLVLELVATISVALVAVWVGLRLVAGHIDFETALVVLLLAPEAYWPLRRVGAEFHAAAEGAAAFRAAGDVLAAAPEHHGGLTAPPGDLVVSGLRVGYGDHDVLSGVDAHFAGPGLTAITGPSGCGKSTLLAALLGELPLRAGRMAAGGVDLREIAPDAWRAAVSWAPQRPWLTPGSIGDNVRLGRPDAGDGEVWRALERVDLAATVAAMPEGLDTELGEDGAGLSAGQRARVALARVVLARRPYVVLDEPSAHLDVHTEQVVLDTLRGLARTATVIVVAHRPAVVAIADHVVDLGAMSPAVAPDPRRASPIVVDRALPGVEEVEAPTPRSARLGARTAFGVVLGVAAVASGVALTATSAWLITRAAFHPPVLTLMVAIVGVRTFGLARPVFRYAERLVSHDSALRLLAQRRTRVYDALVPLVPGRIGRRGDLLTRVVDDVDAVVDARLRVVQPLWTAGAVGLAAVVLAGTVTPVAAVVAVVIVATTVLATWIAHRGARRAEPVFVRRRAGLSVAVADLLTAAREHEMWQATDAALARIDRHGREAARALLESSRAAALGRALVLLACGLGVIATAALAPVSVPSALLALIVLLPSALGDALLPAVDAGVLAARTRAATARLDALESTPPAVTDPGSPLPMPAGAGTLRVEEVSGGWGPSDAIHGVDLVLTPGARIGVVGPSGSGKSTLAALLLRFLDPRAGQVCWQDQSLAAYALDDVRARIGLVDDDPYVFSSSVWENLRLARPTASPAEVATALARAGLAEWVATLPDGVDTMVGDGHRGISGGERARLEWARALLADQPVLVLDEPTAHLDTATARRLTDDILEIRDRSIVWITHGTVGLDRMDQIVALGEQREDAGTASTLTRSSTAAAGGVSEALAVG
jgi:ATP-binding cassette subfamily C protein CydCD